MNKRTIVAASLVFLVTAGLSSCGGPETDSADPTAESAGTLDESESASPTDNPEPEAREANCTLKGKNNAKVTLVDTGDAVVLTFKGQRVPASGTVGYYADMWDETGEVGGQVGMQYQNGELLSFFYFDSVAARQTNLEGEPTPSGSTITGVFPDEALGDLADTGAARWSAALSLNGKDVGFCPGGYRTQPFPG